VSLGFWTALSGFVLLCLGGDPTPSPDRRPRRPPSARGAHGDRHADSQ
jgi:membrane glycosyltransferase